MRDSYKRRPEDFKRRVVQRVYTNRLELLVEEHKWTSQIKDEQLGKKFYNLSKKHCGHWSSSESTLKTVAEKVSAKLQGRPPSEETKQKMSEVRRGKKKSDEHRRNMSLAKLKV